MKTRYVLKNKRRFSIFIITLVVLLVTFICTATVYGYKETTYKTILVKSGDTLWGIANQYNTKGDIRKYIYEIRKINQLASNDIYEGNELRLPLK